MPSPTLRLRPGSPVDVEDMCETVLDAFSGNMVGRTFFPRTSASARKSWLDALAEEVHDPNVERADEEGVECYLDATPEGKHLYEMFDFKDHATWCFFNETYQHSFMVRDAARKVGESPTA